jgi:multidrug efflux pump subunit AcrA (membrane-fusion protein)
VYAAPAAGAFERRDVALGPRLDDRWIVTTGLAPDERIVVAGAARLLSAEVVGGEAAAD